MADTIDIQNTNEWLAEVQAAARELVNVLKAGVNVGVSGELGDAALADTLDQIGVGNLVELQAMLGMPGYNVAKKISGGSANDYKDPGVFYFDFDTRPTDLPRSIDGFLIVYRKYNSNRSRQIFLPVDRPETFHRATYSTGDYVSWSKALDSTGYTVDPNGFIKTASPIFRLANTAADAMGMGYTDGGAGAANNEALGVTATHDDTGVYTVTGSLGFATEGWSFELPQDDNRNVLCFLETEQAADGTITVRVFSRKFDINTASVVAGDPMDIPDERFVSLRLSMPEPQQPDVGDDAAEQEHTE